MAAIKTYTDPMQLLCKSFPIYRGLIHPCMEYDSYVYSMVSAFHSHVLHWTGRNQKHFVLSTPLSCSQTLSYHFIFRYFQAVLLILLPAYLLADSLHKIFCYLTNDSTFVQILCITCHRWIKEFTHTVIMKEKNLTRNFSIVYILEHLPSVD